MAGGWGCPHEVDEICTKINSLPCSPGMKGCVLAGRYVFADEAKNARLRGKQAREAAVRNDNPPTADDSANAP